MKRKTNAMNGSGERLEGPSVGVVMRTKNRPALLRRAIESVATQTYRNWELIVVNDGGDPIVVNELVSLHQEALVGRVRVIHNKKSVGMEGASNLALRRLNTDLAIVHDDDDTWAPEFLSRMTTALEIERSTLPNIGGIVCHCNRVLESVAGNLVTVAHQEPYNQWLGQGLISLDRVLESNPFPPISFLFDLQICRDIGYFNETLPVLGDWEFHIRFLLQKEICVFSEVLAFYHHRVDGIGTMGNSIFEGSDKHHIYRRVLENEWLRQDIRNSRFGLGSYVALRNHLMELKSK